MTCYVTLQMTSLGESRLTLPTSVRAGNLCEVADQECVPRIKTHCQNWPTNFILVGGKVSQDEVAVGLHRVRRNALFEMLFKQGQVLVGQAATKARAFGEKGFLEFSGFAHIVSHMRTPMNSNAAEEATLVPIGVQSQNSALVAEPIR